MTVAHKNLTGTDLHEPKGADTAASDKVYVSNGAGSGTWQKLTASQLQTSGNSFGAQLLHVREEQASNTNSTSPIVVGSWNTLTLNTVSVNEIASASLSSDQIVLPAGTYFIEAAFNWMVTANGGEAAARGRLRNVTDSTTLLFGLNQHLSTAGAAAALQQTNSLKGRFTLAGTKTISLQAYRAGASQAAKAMNVGTEVYTDVLIWKVS